MAKQKNRHKNNGNSTAPTSSVRQQEPEVRNPKGANALKKAEHWLDRNRVMAGLTALILFTYIAGNIFSCKQLGITRSTLEVDQRAWLKVDLTGKMLVIENSPIMLDVGVTNAGKTPAKDISFMATIEIVSNGSQPDFNGTHTVNTYTSNMLFPGEIVTPPIHVKTLSPSTPFPAAKPLSHEDYQRLIEGKAWIAVYGKITYKDFFDNSRWIQFCGWNSPSPLPVAVTARSCSDYNGMN